MLFRFDMTLSTVWVGQLIPRRHLAKSYAELYTTHESLKCNGPMQFC